MLEYAHLLPGRLRLKNSQLKHRSKATGAEVYVSAIPGVSSAVANYATGSLTINFDTDRLAISELWARLAMRGYVVGPCPKPAMTGAVIVDHFGAVRIGRAVMTAFIEAIAQHSAQAIVRALL